MYSLIGHYVCISFEVAYYQSIFSQNIFIHDGRNNHVLK